MLDKERRTWYERSLVPIMFLLSQNKKKNKKGLDIRKRTTQFDRTPIIFYKLQYSPIRKENDTNTRLHRTSNPKT